jgi:hypothetical protein
VRFLIFTIETIVIPTCNIVFYIIGNAIHFVLIANDTVIEDAARHVSTFPRFPLVWKWNTAD